jgi:hypothetical protein
MHAKSMLMTLLLGTLLGASSLAGAVDEQQNKEPAMPGMERMDMDHGMQGGTHPGGMQGCDMMGMRSGATMQAPMMRGGMMDMMRARSHRSASMMPQLPPGNEKLQLQMQAEMMQKMGEILGKYAERIKDEQPAMR